MYVSQYHKWILLLLIQGTVKVGSLVRQELIVLHLGPGASEVLAFVSPNHLRSQRCKFNFLFVYIDVAMNEICYWRSAFLDLQFA